MVKQLRKRDYSLVIEDGTKIGDMIPILMEVMVKCGAECKTQYSVDLEIEYCSLETDEEYESRIDRIAAETKRELATLARLKAKYES